MESDEIREILAAEPFEPFRLKLSSGDAYDVRDPQSVAVLRTRLFVARSGGDRWVFVPFEHIAAIDSIPNGHRPRAKPRKKR